MGSEPGPYTAGRRLCLALRRAREAAALTQAQVARQLSWSTSKLMRIEAGDVGIGVGDLERLCAVYDLGPAVFEELSRLAQAAKRRGWWHEFQDVFAEPAVTLMAMEMEATRLRHWSPMLVPGLFQTPRYAEAVVTGIIDHFGEEEATGRRRLTARLRRQDVIFGRTDPPELTICLDESVLYRVVGDRNTMTEQIRWLAELGRRPYVRVRIRPFESHVASMSEFVLMEFDDGETAVYGEEHMRAFQHDDEAASRTFEDLFAILWRTSLDGPRTGQLLHRVTAQYEQGLQARPWLLD
jgi:transcriptional regulator with XRE-family HTH domain